MHSSALVTPIDRLPVDRLRFGLIVLAAAPVTWIVGVFFVKQTEYLVPLVVVLAGAALATWAVPANQRILGMVALAVAALGIALFYDFDLVSDLENRAGGIVVLGLAIAAIAVAVETPSGLAAGLLVIASGGALWVYLDWWVWEWQVGNLLMVGGGLWSAFEAWRHH